MAESLDLLKGTLDLLVLRTLAWGPAHGYAVSRWIAERTQEVLRVDEAALYQSLHRLERRALVASEWGLSENNRRAKYYSLTSDGRRALRAESQAWRKYAGAVFRVLDFAG
jgi:transcriptional regulator